MNKISKWKINKIAMIMNYVGAVIYFMSIALITGAAFSDATNKNGGNSTSGLAFVLYGYAVVSVIVHVIGFINAKKFGIKRDAYIWGICGNALFVLGAIFSIPSTVLVCIAGYKLGKMRNIEDDYYKNGVDYSDITEKVKATTIDIKDKAVAINKNISSNTNNIACPSCKKQYSKEMNFCPECGTPKPKEKEKKRCSGCGKEIEEDIVFCPECGTKIEA